MEETTDILEIEVALTAYKVHYLCSWGCTLQTLDTFLIKKGICSYTLLTFVLRITAMIWPETSILENEVELTAFMEHYL